jgi:hypothetical protein
MEREERSPYLDTAEAATYLGFRTRNGIRQCVYRGELVPDGRGYRGGYVFLRETLDRFVVERLERWRSGPMPPSSSSTTSRAKRSTLGHELSLREMVAGRLAPTPPRRRKVRLQPAQDEAPTAQTARGNRRAGESVRP